MSLAVNDLDLTRWRDYDDILTGSLWLFEHRDNSGAHAPWYWGNFIPQIPRQVMRRFTRQGDWVLDPFLGSGTTLIEARRLGRHGLGVELVEETAWKAEQVIAQEANPYGVSTPVVVGDSTSMNFAAVLQPYQVSEVQLLVLHPPYHDIIRFSSHPRDLSNAPSVVAFLQMFGEVLDRTLPVLAPARYLVVVIGDKYQNGQWLPLGFYTLAVALLRGCTLKGIIIKDFQETRAKRGQRALWRYRALKNGLVGFEHEYVLVLQKAARRHRQQPDSFPAVLQALWATAPAPPAGG